MLEENEMIGCYRGIVESVDDPEKRGRYRVRVRMVHEDITSVGHLPWAEVCGFGGRGFGDVAHYENGDLVWVQFENGVSHLPIIIGGWLSNRSGIQDLIPEQTLDYKNDRYRWHHIDRASNTIELSSRGNELHIKLQSGNAKLIVSQMDDSIRVDCAGSVHINAPQVTVTAKQAFTIASDIIHQSNGVSDAGDNDGQNNIYSNDRINMVSDNDINVGQYLDDSMARKAHQSLRVTLQPVHTQLGVKDENDLKRTITTNVEAHTEVKILSNSRIKLEAPSVSIVGSERLDLQSPKVTINGTSSLKLQGDNIDVTATKRLDLICMPLINFVTRYWRLWAYFTRSFRHSGKGSRI